MDHPPMKKSTSLLLATFTSLLFLSGIPAAHAGEIFSSDFSKGTFAGLGWDVKGDWSIVDFGADKPGLAKNPGMVAKFPANSPAIGSLVKKFPVINRPYSLTLTFDAGYGWGAKDHSQGFQVMLLDEKGDGYIFAVQRANATWGAQWANVTKYEFKNPMTWAPAAIDTTQVAIADGGGLRTFTITRDAGGKWTFNGDGWTGGPVAFADKKTTSFSMVILRGTPNTDDIAFGKVKLEAEPAR